MSNTDEFSSHSLTKDEQRWFRWQKARVLLPYLGIPLGIVAYYFYGFSWLDFILMSIGIAASGVGFSVGLHRHFTHVSFKATPMVRKVFAVFGLMASHLTIQEYVATHRCHHSNADQPKDPHSPHFSRPDGSPNIIAGLYHSHTGWLLKKDLKIFEKVDRFASNLLKDDLVTVYDSCHKKIILASLLLPALLGGLISMTWAGAITGFIWGGLLRMLVVDQVEGFGRGFSHRFGKRPLGGRDKSTNSAYAYLAMGEWHNNHHAFPNSAKHGFKPWQLDSGYEVIVLLEKLGLVWDVVRIEPSRIEKRAADHANQLT